VEGEQETLRPLPLLVVKVRDLIGVLEALEAGEVEEAKGRVTSLLDYCPEPKETTDESDDNGSES